MEQSRTECGSQPLWRAYWTFTTTLLTDKIAQQKLKVVSNATKTKDNTFNPINFIYLDGYTVSDVVMYWRDEPVVGVEVYLII